MPFTDARMRLDRAKANRHRLHDEIRSWHAAHPDAYTARVKGDPDGVFQLPDGRLTLVARVTEQPPKEWGMLVGDILGDLRSSLDYAVYALAVAHTGQDPPPGADRLEFPIAQDPVWFASKRAKSKIAGLNKPARDCIEAIQPYQPDYGGPAGKHIHSPLWILNELVGVSKHRFIHVFWAILDTTRFQIRSGGGIRIDRIEHRKMVGPLKDGAELADVFVSKPNVAAKGEMELGVSLGTQVAFEGFSAFGAQEVYSGLSKIGGPVEDVLNRLEAFL